MKETFNNLPFEKKNRIIDSCIREFGEYGYDKSSLSRIIEMCGISKGGLYEYIDTKEELFIFIVEYTYKLLYDYIDNYLIQNSLSLSDDILERFHFVSTIAIDFYIEHPDIIRFFVKINTIYEDNLNKRVEDIFLDKFLSLFNSVSTKNLKYGREKILELLRWLLLKTRAEFLIAYNKTNNSEKVKSDYFDNWNFYISILKDGIYI